MPRFFISLSSPSAAFDRVAGGESALKKDQLYQLAAAIESERLVYPEQELKHGAAPHSRWLLRLPEKPTAISTAFQLTQPVANLDWWRQYLRMA